MNYGVWKGDFWLLTEHVLQIERPFEAPREPPKTYMRICPCHDEIKFSTTLQGTEQRAHVISRRTLYIFKWKMKEVSQKHQKYRLTSYSRVFWGPFERNFISPFCITRPNSQAIVNGLAWLKSKTRTSNKFYFTNDKLSTFIVLRRQKSMCQRMNLIWLFYQYPSHMGEIFWKKVLNFTHAQEYLFTDHLNPQVFGLRAGQYAAKIEQKCSALDNCVYFVNCTVLDIA